VIKDGLTQYQMVLFGGYMVDIRFGKTLFSLLCRVCRGSGTLFSMNITIARLIDDRRGIRVNPAGRLITSRPETGCVAMRTGASTAIP
jgi:hypothetical protein